MRPPQIPPLRVDPPLRSGNLLIEHVCLVQAPLSGGLHRLEGSIARIWEIGKTFCKNVKWPEIPGFWKLGP